MLAGRQKILARTASGHGHPLHAQARQRHRQGRRGEAIELLPRHGTLVSFGVPNKDNPEGLLEMRPLLTHLLPFEDIQRGFEIAYECPEEHSALKVILKF